MFVENFEEENEPLDYCAYCHDEITQYEKMTVIEEIKYHTDCFKILNNYYNPFE